MKLSPIAPMFETDAYKQAHINLFPKGTTKTYSNYTNRSTRIEGLDHVVNFGLQAYIKNYIMDAFEDFFAADEDLVASLYEKRVKGYLGVDHVDVTHVRNLHRLGYLPLEFKQLPEGSFVPLGVPSFTIENTHPDFAFLTNYIETSVSFSIWHASSVATLAAYARNMLEAWADKTGSPRAGIDFQFHDFSARGQTSAESAAKSGAAHLLSFSGSDTLSAEDWIDYLYPGEDNGQLFYSVPATEHSVMSSGTAYESEEATYLKILAAFPKGIVSVVSDTYSIWNVVERGGILDRIRDTILGRDGKLVIRPDSGDPVDILTGLNHEFGKGVTSEDKGVIELLWEVFGGTVNEAGYKVLDSHISTIYGDGITADRLNRIMDRMEKKGFASSNVALGVGAFFYQVLSRDSVGGSAVKMTKIWVNGVGIDIMKDPITGSGKKSATGLLAVFRDENREFCLVQKATEEQEAASEIKTVWKDGKFVHTQSFADIRGTLQAETKRVFG